MSRNSGWVGFDLDGTLAVYDGWKGIDHIGKPIAPVVAYANSLRAEGIEIRIVTARCQEGDVAFGPIVKWCEEVFGKDCNIGITDRKDFNMVALVDDRAITVEKNTGKFLTPVISAEAINWHHSPNNPENPDYVANTNS